MPSRFVRRSLVVLTHLAIWVSAWAVSFALRFDTFPPPSEYVAIALRVLPLVLLVRAVTFWRAGLFHGVLRYAGVPDLLTLLRATVVGSVILSTLGFFVHPLWAPRSIFVLEALLCLAGTAGLRLGVRIVRDRHANSMRGNVDAPAVILLGAGNAGELLVRDALRSGAFRVVAILDDDSIKHGGRLHGIPVSGPINRVTLAATSRATGATRVLLAMPTAPGMRTREIFELCRELGLVLKTLPSLQQIADGDVRISRLRDVAIEDLLRRDVVRIDDAAVSRFVAGKSVLVTGAAGSIGSELVRQLARFSPSRIVLFDHNENGLFFLEREIRELAPNVNLVIRLGNVCDPTRLRQVFEESAPRIVYHAAAHKHVPITEDNAGAAILNNVIGTKNVADAAVAAGCEAFVLISTDKAVNPSSVMGATKRVAEMYTQALASASPRTKLVAVRFGNVLGSAGSVIPIFRQQLERGGPISVTHPEMRRYFMTIPEATQLVIQASSIGDSGRLYMLDMGEAVRIVDLAEDMIRLSGLRPNVDVQIQFTGIRPGEKLFEELHNDDERTEATAHPKIRGVRGAARDLADTTAAIERLARLAVRVADARTLRAELEVLVPEARLSAAPATETAPSIPAPAQLVARET